MKCTYTTRFSPLSMRYWVYATAVIDGKSYTINECFLHKPNIITAFFVKRRLAKRMKDIHG